MLILFILLNLLSIEGRPEDSSCFDVNFPSFLNSDPDNGRSRMNYQQVYIKQVYEYVVRNTSDYFRNETIVKTEPVELDEGEIKRNLEFESHVPEMNPRNFILFYDGHLIQGAIGHYFYKVDSEGITAQWTCKIVNTTAPEKANVAFSTSLVTEDVDNTTTLEYDSLEIEILQNDVSCFRENFPDNRQNNPKVDECENRNLQAVNIKHIVTNSTATETTVKEMREMLVKGEKQYVELTSQTTDILNPRYLVMLFDGVTVKASINYISQQYPTLSHCRIFNDSAPNTWYLEFATNADTSSGTFIYSADALRVEFLDPSNPWGDEQDLECFGIQFPECANKRIIKGDDISNASINTIHISHYYKQGWYKPPTVEVETFLVNVTEGIAKIIQVEYKKQSTLFEDENPRNLSLLLVGSELHVGIGQLFDDGFGDPSSEWTCGNSSAVIEVDSEKTTEIMFYRARYTEDAGTIWYKEFLSFSWSKGGGNILHMHGTWRHLVLIISMSLYCTYLL